MSDALKSNTTLTELDLRCEDKRKKTHKRHTSTIHSFFLIKSTVNNIGDTGATSLSEALKSNTTLIELNLIRKDKRHTKDTHQQFTLFSIRNTSTGNKIGDKGAKSMSESLKSNTTLTELDLSGEDKKKEDTHKTSINNSLFSILITSIGNKIGDTGATSLSESLKSNTTLTKLNMMGED